MILFDTRDEMVEKLVPKNGVYAELGVFTAQFSNKLYSMLRPSKLVLVDLFNDRNSGSGDQDGNNFSHANLITVYEKIKHDTRFTVIRGDTSSIILSFPDQTFDMIYIDADHSYEGCKKDLNAALKKVKAGGWIMGHDYEINHAKARTNWVFGVYQAVNEFCSKNNLTIAAKGNDGCVSYAIQLPSA